MKTALKCISIGLFLISLLPAQAIGGRVALVIGNADYARGTGWSDLPPAIQDAETIAKVLKNPLGFDRVIHKTNLNRQQMLDACRNNPLSDRQKSFGGTGLKGMKRTAFNAETIIGFATEPGKTAITGNTISPYTQALSEQLRQPNKSLWAIFGATSRAVKTNTNGAQIPWKEDNLEQAHILYATAPPPPRPVVTTPTKLPYEPEMVTIPGGSFRMGDIQGGGNSEEKPVHQVNIKSFMLGKYEVTLGQFKAFTQASGYQTDAEKNDSCYIWKESKWQKQAGYSYKNPGFKQTDQHPVACVSWNDAQAYIQWLN